MASTRVLQDHEANDLVKQLRLSFERNGDLKQIVHRGPLGEAVFRTTVTDDEARSLGIKEEIINPPVRREPDPEPKEPQPEPRPGNKTGYMGFGVDAWPDENWQPFRESSVWRQPIPVGIEVHPQSEQIVRNILIQAGGKASNLVVGSSATKDKDYSHPVYFAQTDDPIVELYATRNPYNITRGEKIRCPAQAKPANGSDGHMCIVQPDGTTYDLWQARAPVNGRIYFSIGSRTNILSDGMDAKATASHMQLLAGVIRPEELLAGRINHPLFCTIPRGSTSNDFGYGVRLDSSGRAFVYPAPRGDAGISGPNQPPMGCRLGFDMSDEDISALNVPTWKKTILFALAKYGAYFCDTGGPGLAFQFISGQSYTSFGRKDPMVEYAKQIRIREGSGDWAGTYVFDLGSGIDWSKHLKVLAPPARS